MGGGRGGGCIGLISSTIVVAGGALRCIGKPIGDRSLSRNVLARINNLRREEKGEERGNGVSFVSAARLRNAKRDEKSLFRTEKEEPRKGRKEKKKKRTRISIPRSRNADACARDLIPQIVSRLFARRPRALLLRLLLPTTHGATCPLIGAKINPMVWRLAPNFRTRPQRRSSM